MLFSLSAANISLPKNLAIKPLFLPLGESLKKPTLFESMSDILELEEGSGGGGGTHSSSHQTHTLSAFWGESQPMGLNIY